MRTIEELTELAEFTLRRATDDQALVQRIASQLSTAKRCIELVNDPEVQLNVHLSYQCRRQVDLSYEEICYAAGIDPANYPELADKKE